MSEIARPDEWGYLIKDKSSELSDASWYLLLYGNGSIHTESIGDNYAFINRSYGVSARPVATK